MARPRWRICGENNRFWNGSKKAQRTQKLFRERSFPLLVPKRFLSSPSSFPCSSSSSQVALGNALAQAVALPVHRERSEPDLKFVFGEMARLRSATSRETAFPSATWERGGSEYLAQKTQDAKNGNSPPCIYSVIIFLISWLPGFLIFPRSQVALGNEEDQSISRKRRRTQRMETLPHVSTR